MVTATESTTAASMRVAAGCDPSLPNPVAIYGCSRKPVLTGQRDSDDVSSRMDLSGPVVELFYDDASRCEQTALAKKLVGETINRAACLVQLCVVHRTTATRKTQGTLTTLLGGRDPLEAT
jgi:hypothetical protein